MPLFTAVATIVGTISSWTIGLGAFGTFAVGNFLLRAAVQLGVSALTKVFAGGKDGGDQFSIQGSIRTGGAVPRSFVFGPALTAGSLAWHTEWGKVGGTPNAYYTQVIALSDLPVAGLSRVFINGAAVTLDTVANEKGFAALEYRENGVDFAWVRFHDGTQRNADEFLTGTVSHAAPRDYSADRVGTGIAYAIVTFRINQDMFTGFPACKFVLDGVRLYDITKDTSAGGSGLHRWGDPTTWGGDGDALPGVHAYNLARGLYYGSPGFGGGSAQSETVVIGSGQAALSIKMVAGGGGGITAGVGGDTVVTLKDGASVVKVWTATGGGSRTSATSVGEVSPFPPYGAGADGQLEIFEGGSEGAGLIQPAISGGGAGALLVVSDYDISALAAPVLEIVIGAGAPGAGEGYALYSTDFDPAALVRHWFYGLQGLTAARLPSAQWIAQINKCRALVDGEAGLEPIYRCAGEVTVNSEMGSAFEAVLTACAGRMSEVGGVFKLYVGAPDAAVAHIDDAEILSLAPQTFTPFFGLSNTVNGVTASYPSPDEGYVMRSTPPLYNAAYEAEDGGRRLLANIALNFVPFPVQAQRLLQGELAAARRARRHTFSLPAKFRRIEPGDTVTWTSARNGYFAKLFRIDGVIDLPNCDLIVDMTEVDPADHGSFNYVTDYDPAVPSPVISVQPSPQSVIGFNPVAANIQDDTGTALRAALLMQWLPTVDDIEGIRFEIRSATTGVVVSDPQTRRFSRGDMLIDNGLVPDTIYEVRAKYIPGSRRRVSWTSWKSVATPDTRIGPALIADDVWTKIGDDAATTASGLIDAYDTATLAPLTTRIGTIEDTALALDGTVQDNVADIDRVETDLTANLPVIQDAQADIDTLNERVIEMTLAQRDLGTKMAAAGIYVDPDTGQVKLEATARIDDGLALLTLGLDAANAEITTRVTYSTLADVVAAAALDPTALLDFAGITGRVSAVELVQSGLDARFAAYSITATVTQQGLTLTQAGLDIDSLNEAIALRVTNETFGAVETRMTQAEQTLGTMDGARLAQSVLDVNATMDDLDDLTESAISDLLAARIDNQTWRADLAYARQDFNALADDNGAAIASVSIEVGAFKADTAAQIITEALTRATDDAALSQQITSLEAVTGTQTVSLDEINRVAADSDSANARALNQVQIDVNGPGGVAQAVTALEGRVDTNDGKLEVAASERTNLFAGVGDAEDLAAEGGLRALLEGREAQRLAQSGLAQAREDLTAKVIEDVSAEAARRVELDAALGDATARLDRDLAVLAIDGAATAQSLLALGATVDGVDVKAESLLQLTATDTTAFGQWYNRIHGDVYDPETGLAKTRGQVDDIVNFSLDDTSVLFNKLSGVSTEVFGADGVSGLKASSALRQVSIDGIRAGFSLTVNNNGHISGITATSDLADGVNASSDLLFAADKMFFMGEIYAVGTVNVTNGSKNITGTGTLWAANAAAGDWFTGPDGRSYQIASVDSNTALTLGNNYQGQTGTGETYGIAKGNPLLSVYTVDTVVDGVLIPKGVYLNDAMIRRAVIGRAQITDVLESDNYAEDAGGVPTQGVKIDFKNDVVKLAGPVISRNIVMNKGQFSVTGNMVNGTEYLFVNSGIRMGKNDVWAVTNDTFIAVATVTSGATGPGGLDGNNAFWGLTTRLSSGARWFGYPGTAPTLNYRRDPATIVNMPGNTGTDQRLFFHIKLDSTGGVYFVNPTIKWKIFRVT